MRITKLVRVSDINLKEIKKLAKINKTTMSKVMDLIIQYYLKNKNYEIN
jgi:hypothetical protein